MGMSSVDPAHRHSKQDNTRRESVAVRSVYDVLGKQSDRDLKLTDSVMMQTDLVMQQVQEVMTQADLALLQVQEVMTQSGVYSHQLDTASSSGNQTNIDNTQRVSDCIPLSCEY
uniref:Uncharacterized protein n=1 Tax=Cacopsylla melanoneura TaxID=428564 RepID=A0A8D9AVJ7_9HEMI